VRQTPAGVIASLAIGAVAALATALELSAPLTRLAQDALVRSAVGSESAPSGELPDAVLVAIDPQSLRALPEWPWPRRLYASAVENLGRAGARAIALDIDFSAEREPDDDAALAYALGTSGRTVLASFRQVQLLPGGAQLEIMSRPAPALEAAAAALGSVLLPVDPDGVLRRAPRVFAVGDRELSSRAGAALAVATGEAPRPSTAGDELLAIDYRRAEPAVPRLSFSDVVLGHFDPESVAGRTVFVGATSAELQDLWPTPLGPARPGVLVQALLYRTLAAEQSGASVLRSAGFALQLGLTLGLVASAAAAHRWSHRRRTLLLASLALGTASGAAWLVARTGILVDPVVPLASLGLQYVAGLESVRSRFRRELEVQEHSLTALFRVGEATTGRAGAGALDSVLALLGDVVDASGVALLRSDAAGRLDGRRVEWRRRGAGEIGSAESARDALARRALLVVPTRGASRALSGCCVYAPLVAGDQTVGALVVERDSVERLDATRLRTIATAGAQLALTIENLKLVDSLRATFESSVEALASAVEARDGYTVSHCRRLAAFSSLVCERLGLSEQETESVRMGALLHDVGKIGIRDEVLLKPGRLSPDERAVMESHAAIGHRIAVAIHGLSPTTLSCIRHHHERWDGEGYPDRLAGSDIPLGARIVSVVDVWDALSTARPYKPAFESDEVLGILRKDSGRHFDPEVVDVFFRILEDEGEELLALLGGAPGVRA
jgi:putative nucleotidyltransferase with HDIG domain